MARSAHKYQDVVRDLSRTGRRYREMEGRWKEVLGDVGFELKESRSGSKGEKNVSFSDSLVARLLYFLLTKAATKSRMEGGRWESNV